MATTDEWKWNSGMPMRAYQDHRELKILSASPLELVSILHEAAIEAVAEARQRMRAGDIPARTRLIGRVSLILTELAANVNREKGGQLAMNLLELYDYMQRRLTTANAEQKEAPLAEVQRLLETLHSGWREIAGESTPRGSIPPPEHGQVREADYAPVAVEG